MNRLAILLLVISLATSCQMRGTKDPLGFTMAIPDDLPELCRQKEVKSSGTEIAPAKCRDVYKAGYRGGWESCIVDWQWNRIDLAKSISLYELPDDPWVSDIDERARRDGYEECRKMLVRNGAESSPSVKP